VDSELKDMFVMIIWLHGETVRDGFRGKWL